MARIGYRKIKGILQERPMRSVEDALGEGAGVYSIIAFVFGVLLMVAVSAFFSPQKIHPIVADVLHDIGLAFTSVFGVSYVYEKLSARRQFEKFFLSLEVLIRRGESNAALCAALGILEIHSDRQSYEERHSFADEVGTLGQGDTVRVSGRSLIFAMYGWKQFQKMLSNGASLELCMFDPAIRSSPLTYLSGYSSEETAFAIHRFISSVQPWLSKSGASGSIDIRFHDVHLLDSFVEIRENGVARAAWDLNFGEGTETRHILLLDLERDLGRNLASQRYGPIWDGARSVFLFRNKAILLDDLSAKSE